MVDSWLMVDFCLDDVIEAQYSKRHVTKVVRICEDEIFLAVVENWEGFVLVLFCRHDFFLFFFGGVIPLRIVKLCS